MTRTPLAVGVYGVSDTSTSEGPADANVLVPRLLLAGTAVVVLALGATGASGASELRQGGPASASTATEGIGNAAAFTPPCDTPTLPTAFGLTCFQSNGDVQWVLDRIANGWTTVARVETNYGKLRNCSAKPAAQGWTSCNYDHREDSCVRFLLLEQQNVSIRNVSPWSDYYRVSNGDRC